ncbi:MAG: hypothetical protein F6K31_08560 [Symploca sp. SIO2G7]|nr:hypothetical protein [Symploca sp. SIO2G7]
MNLDQQLRQLIEQACQLQQEAEQLPDNSRKRRELVRKRRHLLNQLIYQMQQSGEIKRDGNEHYEEALQRTWIWFSKNFCNFDPEKAQDPEAATVIGWFKFYLYNYKLKDVKREVVKEQQRIYKPPYNQDGTELDILNNLADTHTHDPWLLSTEIRQWLEEKRYELCRIRLRNRPEKVNCYTLLLCRLPQRDNNGRATTWKELEAEFGVSDSTLMDFWNRECFPRLLNFGQSKGWINVAKAIVKLFVPHDLRYTPLAMALLRILSRV